MQQPTTLQTRCALHWTKSQIVVGTVTVQSIHYTNEVVEVSERRDLYISVQDYTTRITR